MKSFLPHGEGKLPQNLDTILIGPDSEKIDASAVFIIRSETKFCQGLLDMLKSGLISEEFNKENPSRGITGCQIL